MTTAPRTLVQTGSYRTMPNLDPLHVVVDDLSRSCRFSMVVDNLDSSNRAELAREREAVDAAALEARTARHRAGLPPHRIGQDRGRCRSRRRQDPVGGHQRPLAAAAGEHGSVPAEPSRQLDVEGVEMRRRQGSVGGHQGHRPPRAVRRARRGGRGGPGRRGRRRGPDRARGTPGRGAACRAAPSKRRLHDGPGPRAGDRVVCGRGRDPTLSPIGGAVFGFRRRGPSGPAPATGPAGRRTGRASPA